MRNHIQPGDTLTLPAPRDLKSGDGAVVGSIFGVANGDAAEGQPADLDVVGVFALPKVAALAIDAGEPVYWDDAVHLVSTDDTDMLIGVATEDAANPSATVAVRLNGSFGA